VRRAKGVSPVVATAFLILISVALVAGLWFFASRMMGGGDVASAQAYLAASRFVGGQHVAVVNLDIDNLADSRLQVVEIRVTGIAGGTASTASLTGGSGSISFGTAGSYSITVNPAPPQYVEPRGSYSFTITFTRGTGATAVLAEVSFVVRLRSDAGAEYTVTSNSVQIS